MSQYPALELTKRLLSAVLETIPGGPDAVALTLVWGERTDMSTNPIVIAKDGVEVTPRLLLQTASDLQQMAFVLVREAIAAGSEKSDDGKAQKEEGKQTQAAVQAGPGKPG